MDIYKSFEEKSKYFKFGGMKIDSEEGFNEYTHLLMKQYSTGDFIFRGLSEAKFKLFNSSQRYWESIIGSSKIDDANEYDNLVLSLITKCKSWNNGTILNLFKTYNILENNSLAFLAFMQHHGTPTPLIDFTKNPNNALFFAINDIANHIESANEMDNYFSIYFTYQNNTAYETFQEVFQKSISAEPTGEFDYKKVSKNGIILISDGDDELKILNNIRIANQEGLFFYNYSPFEPIEVVYKGFIDLLLQKISREKFDELMIHDHFSGCLNFHKKYIEHIKKIITERGITEKFIYPDVNELKEFTLK